MDSFDGNDFAGLSFGSGFESILDDEGPSSTSSPVAIGLGGGVSDGQQTSTSNQYFGQCQRCVKYRSDLERLDKEHRVNFQFLKKKIISTDLLIRRCKAKTDESEAQSKTIEDLNSRLEQADRDSAILSEQLKSTVTSMKPLKDENECLEHMLKTKSSEVNELQIRLAAEEAFKCQRQALDAEMRNQETEVVTFKKKIQNLERRKQGLLARTEKLTREKAAISSEKNIVAKRMVLFGKALQQAQEIVNTQWKKLQLNGLTVGEIKPYVMPASYKSFIANMQSGKVGPMGDGQEEEDSSEKDPLFEALMDIGEISNDDDEEEEGEEAKKDKTGKEREKGKGVNKKNEKKTGKEKRVGNKEEEEAESDGNLSDVSVLSHIDDNEEGCGVDRKKDKGGVEDKGKNDRKSFGFESSQDVGFVDEDATDKKKTSSVARGEEVVSARKKSPVKAKRIFVNDASRDVTTGKNRNFDGKDAVAAGMLSSGDTKHSQIRKSPKGTEKEVKEKKKGEGSKIDGEKNADDLSSLSSSSLSSDSDSDDVNTKKKKDGKQGMFSNLKKLPSSMKGGSSLPLMHFGQKKINVAAMRTAVSTNQNKRTDLDDEVESRDGAASQARKGIGKSPPTAKKACSSGVKKHQPMTYAKTLALKRDGKQKDGGEQQGEGDIATNDLDLDSSSSLSDTSGSEAEGEGIAAAKRKGTTSSPGKNKTSPLSMKGKGAGFEHGRKRVVGLVAGQESLPDVNVESGDNDDDDDDFEMPVLLPFTHFAEGEEKMDVKNIGKAELQALLLLSPLCQVLSPLPPSPCPSAKADDDGEVGGVVGGDGGGGVVVVEGGDGGGLVNSDDEIGGGVVNGCDGVVNGDTNAGVTDRDDDVVDDISDVNVNGNDDIGERRRRLSLDTGKEDESSETSIHHRNVIGEKMGDDGDKEKDGEKMDGDSEKKESGGEKRGDDSEKMDGDSEKMADDSEKRGDDSEKMADDSEKMADDSEKMDGDSEKMADDSEKKENEGEKMDDDSGKKESEGEKIGDDSDKKKNDSERTDGDNKKGSDEDNNEHIGNEKRNKTREVEKGALTVDSLLHHETRKCHGSAGEGDLNQNPMQRKKKKDPENDVGSTPDGENPNTDALNNLPDNGTVDCDMSSVAASDRVGDVIESDSVDCERDKEAGKFLGNDLLLSSDESESESTRMTGLAEQDLEKSETSRKLMARVNHSDVPSTLETPSVGEKVPSRRSEVGSMGSGTSPCGDENVEKTKKLKWTQQPNRQRVAVGSKSNVDDFSSLSSSSSESENDSSSADKMKKKVGMNRVNEESKRIVGMKRKCRGTNAEKKSKSNLVVSQSVEDLSSLSSSSEDETGNGSHMGKKEIKKVTKMNEEPLAKQKTSEINVLNDNDSRPDCASSGNVSQAVLSDTVSTNQKDNDDSVVHGKKDDFSNSVNGEKSEAVPKVDGHFSKTRARKVSKRQSYISKEFIESSPLLSSSEGEKEEEEVCYGAKKSKLEEEVKEKATTKGPLNEDAEKGDGKDKDDFSSPKTVTRSSSMAASVSSPDVFSKSPEVTSRRRVSPNIDWSGDKSIKSSPSPRRSGRNKEESNLETVQELPLEKSTSQLKQNEMEKKAVGGKSDVSQIEQKGSSSSSDSMPKVGKNASVMRKTQMECAAQQLAKMIAKAKSGNARKGRVNNEKKDVVGREIPKAVSALKKELDRRRRPSTRISTLRSSEDLVEGEKREDVDVERRVEGSMDMTGGQGSQAKSLEGCRRTRMSTSASSGSGSVLTGIEDERLKRPASTSPVFGLGGRRQSRTKTSIQRNEESVSEGASCRDGGGGDMGEELKTVGSNSQTDDSGKKSGITRRQKDSRENSEERVGGMTKEVDGGGGEDVGGATSSDGSEIKRGRRKTRSQLLRSSSGSNDDSGKMEIDVENRGGIGDEAEIRGDVERTTSQPQRRMTRNLSSRLSNSCADSSKTDDVVKMSSTDAVEMSKEIICGSEMLVDNNDAKMLGDVSGCEMTCEGTDKMPGDDQEPELVAEKSQRLLMNVSQNNQTADNKEGASCDDVAVNSDDIQPCRNTVRDSLNESQGFTVASLSIHGSGDCVNENGGDVLQKQGQNTMSSKRLSTTASVDISVNDDEVRDVGEVEDGEGNLPGLCNEVTCAERNESTQGDEEGRGEQVRNMTALDKDLDTVDESGFVSDSTTDKNQQTLATPENSAFSKEVSPVIEPTPFISISSKNTVSSPLSISTDIQSSKQTSSTQLSPASFSVQNNETRERSSIIVNNRSLRNKSNGNAGIDNTAAHTLGNNNVPPLHRNFISAGEPAKLDYDADKTSSKETSDPSHRNFSNRGNKTFNPAQPLEVIIPSSSWSSSLSVSELSSSLSLPSFPLSSSSLQSTTTTTTTTPPSPALASISHRKVPEKPFLDVLRDMVNFLQVPPPLSPLSSPIMSPTFPSSTRKDNGDMPPPPLLSSSSSSSTTTAATGISPSLGDRVGIPSTRQQVPSGLSTRQQKQKTSASDSQMMMQAKKLLAAKRKASVLGGKTDKAGDGPDRVKRSRRIAQRASGQTSQGADGDDSATGPDDRASARAKSQQKTISFSGFSSTQDAIDYNLRHFLSRDSSRPTPDVETILDDIDARLKDGNLPEVWFCLVDRTILYLRRHGSKSCTSLELLGHSEHSESTGGHTQVEPLDQTVLGLMLAFIDRHQGEVDKSVLMGAIWSAIFDRLLTWTVVRVCLCRLFCGLCKRFDDLEQARVLLYNIAWCGYLHFSSCLLSMVGVWPGIVPPTPTEDSALMSSSPMCQVFHLVICTEISKDKVFGRQVALALDRLCQWRLQRHRPIVADALVKSLVDAMVQASIDSTNGVGDLFEYTKALELLCVVQGSAWAQEHFVKKAVVGAFQRWSMMSSLSLHANAMVALLKITKTLSAVHSFSESTVRVLGGQVLGKAVVTNMESLPLTLCVGELLMELCPLDPQLYMEFLRQWEDANRSRLPASALAQLAGTRTFFLSAGSGGGSCGGGDKVKGSGGGAGNRNGKNQKKKKKKSQKKT